jgi:NAD(P)-dependent dehydrogenase (short-subunit alcohol dehydrogenase family)
MFELDPAACAVVTGGARGIGLAIVAALADQGVAIACVDHPSADFGPVAEVCAQAGVGYLPVPVDVRDQDAVRAGIATAVELGTVRYAVNCAGVDGFGPSATVDVAEWHRVLDVDLDGVMYASQAEFAVMPQGSSIVNIASMSGHIINRGINHAAYSVAKSGVIHLSKALGVEWASAGVRVNSVSPGYTRTALTDRNPPELNAAFASQTPLQRLAEVAEIAGPVLFLLSSGASFITATDLLVDGGFCAW